MNKKHILLGIAILTAFIIILLIQLAGESMKNSIGSTLKNGLQTLFATEDKISHVEFSNRFYDIQCKTKNIGGKNLLFIKNNKICKATFAKKNGTIVRKLPQINYLSGACIISLSHNNKDYSDEPEVYTLPDPEYNELKLSVFEDGATLNIKTVNSSCKLSVL